MSAPERATWDEVAALASVAGSGDVVGPGTALPLMAIDLTSPAPEDSAAIAMLPCVLVGIGPDQAGSASLCDVLLPDDRDWEGIARNVHAAPHAAMVLVQHLRASDGLDPGSALIAESFAFGCLQAGPFFLRCKETRVAASLPAADRHPVLQVNRDGPELHLVLDRPAERNAINVPLRDALAEALDVALADSSITRVTLEGTGECFSVGAEVAEFGEVSDPVTAHWIRGLRLPARRLARLTDRLTVRVHGAVIGAGLEMAAFAGQMTAHPASWFQLPELRYGLLPGAGGTVSVTRRIGRQRLAYMALSMRRISAQTALQWGLVDAVEE